MPTPHEFLHAVSKLMQIAWITNNAFDKYMQMQYDLLKCAWNCSDNITSHLNVLLAAATMLFPPRGNGASPTWPGNHHFAFTHAIPSYLPHKTFPPAQFNCECTVCCANALRIFSLLCLPVQCWPFHAMVMIRPQFQHGSPAQHTKPPHVLASGVGGMAEATK